MSTYVFSKEELENLRNNEWVKRCKERSITYTEAFKVYAVELAKRGVSAQEIWRRAGLDMSMLKQEYPKGCLKRWKKITGLKGYDGLKEGRGIKSTGRPKIKGVTDEDKIKRLEHQVRYLKAENDFLAKLRAKRAE